MHDHRTPGERMADAAERQADAMEAILGLLQERLPVDKPTPKRQVRERVQPDPEAFLPLDALDSRERAVYEALGRLAGVNASRTRKHVRPVKPEAVRQALADYPAKDHVAVARDYAAWQEHSARTPHADVLAGFRNQLKGAPDVARPTTPNGGGIDRLMSDDALEEAMR